MATTLAVYAAAGALVTSGMFTTFGSLSANAYVYAFFDGEERARVFDNSVALPKVVSMTQVKDPQGNATGGWILSLAYAAGSLDAGSVGYFRLDQQATVLVSSTATGTT